MTTPSMRSAAAHAVGPGGQVAPAFLPALALAAAATTLMLEGTRVFISYLVFVIDQSQRNQIAAVALGVFLAAGILGGPLARLVGARRTIAAGALVLVLARLILQFAAAPEARLVLGAAVLIGWGWLTVGLVATRRDAAALGLAAGIALDLALRIAAHTVDLPWIPGLAADGATILLGVALVAATVRLVRERGPAAAGGSALPLVALGPGLALYHLLTGNLGLAQTRLGAGFPEASAALALGAAAGLALAALSTARPPDRLLGVGRTLSLAALLTLGNELTWRGGALAGPGLVLAGAAGLALLGGALRGGRSRPSGLLGITAGFTLGLLVEMALLFAYYTFTGRPGLIWVAIAVLAAGALSADLLGAGSPVARLATRRRAPALVAAALVASLVVAWGWATLSWATPVAAAPLGRRITVMTYNIQSGFNRDERWDLEATARTIEAQHPDVVVLQEVSRGWLVTSGVDEALWLSHRLNMPYVFGANSEDGLWGNLILTRAPLESEAVRRYSTTRNLERAAVEVRLATTAGDLWVLGTHLDDPLNADDVRLAQIGQLLAFWGGRRPALILGDFNDDPNTPVPNTMVRAGLTDVEATLGPGAYTSHDHRRIDYIFDTPGVTVSSVQIPDVWTSDHRPVVAHVTLQP